MENHFDYIVSDLIVMSVQDQETPAREKFKLELDRIQIVLMKVHV